MEEKYELWERLFEEGNEALLEEDYSLAVDKLRQAVSMAGRDTRLIREKGLALNSLAAAYRFLGRDDDAIESNLKAVAYLEKALEDEDYDLAGITQNVADLYWINEQPEEALEWYNRAVERKIAALGKDHPDVASTRKMRGDVLAALGRLDEAEDAYREAIEALPPEDVNRAPLMRDLGVFLAEHRGRGGEAENLIRTAMELIRQAEESHADPLASVYEEEGEPAEPQQPAADGKLHPELIDCHVRLAEILYNQEKYAEARDELLPVVEDFRHHPDEFEVPLFEEMLMLGACYYMLEDYAAAEGVYREQIEQSRANFGEDFPLIWFAEASLGEVLRDAGRLEEAEEALASAQRSFERSGEAAPGYNAYLKRAVAELRLQQGRAEEARELLRDALEGFREAETHDDPAEGSCLASLGRVEEAKGDLKAAAGHFQDALKILERAAPNHTLTAKTHEEYAGILEKSGETTRAQKEREKAAQIREE